MSNHLFIKMRNSTIDKLISKNSMGYSQSEHKIVAVSYIRLIAMCFIIICHFLQYYNNELAWWFNVGVQIFFIMSGFLYGGKQINDPISFIKKQFKKILIPYYMFLFPVSIIYFIFNRQSITIASFIKSVFCVGTIDGLEHLWFVGYILFCYILTPYLFCIKKKLETSSIIKITLVSLSCLGFVVIYSTLLHSYFNGSRICCYIIGYFMAVYYSRYGYGIMKVFAILFSAVAIPTNIVRIYLKYFCIIPQDSIVEKLFGFSEGYMHLVLGAMIFLLLFILLRKAKSCLLIEKTDGYSYYIYIVHQLFILSPFTLMDITNYNVLNLVIVCMCIIVASYTVYMLSRIAKRLIENRRT